MQSCKWLKAESLNRYIESAGAQTPATTPDEFSRFVLPDVARWGKVIRDMHLELDR